MDVRLPDGTIIQNVPDGMSKADLSAKLIANGYKFPTESQKQQTIHNDTTVYDPVSGVPLYSSDTSGEGATGTTKKVADVLRTVAAAPIAFAAGAGRPLATIARALPGNFGKDMSTAQDQIVQGLGQATDSEYLMPGMELAGQVAGTAGIGGLMGKGAAAIPAIARFSPALSSGGFNLGGAATNSALANAAIRAGSGAAVGYAGAGLVNPDDANTGAILGGAIPLIAPVSKAVISTGKKILGGTTGVGEESIAQAYKAGKTGGESGKSFIENMRGISQMDDVLGVAKQNLQNMQQQKQAAYRSGMVDIKGDKSVLGFDGVDSAIKNAFEMVSFKGQIKNEKAAQALQKISDDVANWKSLDPSKYHTPEGLDALKQRIGAVLEGIPYEQKTARKAVGDIYTSVKTAIGEQAPTYSKVMQDYSQASNAISEIESALSLGKKASTDTSMRKLQSLMRNNVNTSYGYRTNLANKLEQDGGNQLMPALAGQALSEWTPRGIQKATAGTGGLGLALTGNIPAAIGMAAASSPRLVGEAAYGAGAAANKLGLLGLDPSNLAYLLSQIGQRTYLGSSK